MEFRKPLEGEDIIVTGLQPWDIQIGSNCKDIAKVLSKNNRILYVNYPLDRVTWFREKDTPKVKARVGSFKGKDAPIAQVDENIWVLNPRIIIESINWIPGRILFDHFNKINNRRLAKEIQYAIDGLGFKDIVLFNDNEFIRTFYLPDLIDHKLAIYYLRDNLTSQDYFKVHGERLEHELMKKVDYVMANSAYLATYASEYNPQSFYVGQGFDTSTYEGDFDIPEDISHLKRPIIGYIGSLNSIRLDIPLLERIADHFKDHTLTLVGPEDEVFQKSALHSKPNVHFLGRKDPSLVPNYIKSFDVCINPQMVNDMTIGNYPRKVDEYLIMGKPVIARSTQGMQEFKDHVYLAESHDGFLSQIRRAFIENSEGLSIKRKSYAGSHTWEHSVDSIRKSIAVESVAATI